MDNLKSPAYPDPQRGAQQSFTVQAPEESPCGFTKLELASLMIAQGMYANGRWNEDAGQQRLVATNSVEAAKMVLEEANK